MDSCLVVALTHLPIFNTMCGLVTLTDASGEQDLGLSFSYHQSSVTSMDNTTLLYSL